MLTILEGLGNFIKHGVSFLFLPTDFQALSFTSPPALATWTSEPFFNSNCLDGLHSLPPKDKMPASGI